MTTREIRNVSETSYAEERGVRRRRLRILADTLSTSLPNPRTTENPIAFYGRSGGFSAVS